MADAQYWASLDQFFREAIARQLGIPLEELTEETIATFRRRLRHSGSTSSLGGKQDAFLKGKSIEEAEEEDREARRFLANFAENDEDRRVLLER